MLALPESNTFIVVQLDPVDSVSHLDNPVLTEACRELSNKKYLAYVGLRDGLFWPDVPYYSFEFLFVHRGLKERDETGQSVDPGMCVPVLPNTSHPLGREPLDPGQPLPWNDCYVSPFFAVNARSRNIILDEEPQTFKLSIDDAVRLSGFVRRDRQDLADRLHPELQARYVSDDDSCIEWAGSESEFADEEMSESESVDGASIDGKSTDGETCEDECECKSKDGDEWNPTGLMEEQRHFEEILDEFDEMDAMLMEMVALKASFDLSELEEVTDPAEFFEELKALTKLKEEHVINKELEIEKARRIDEEFFSKLSQPNAPSTTTTSSSCSQTSSPTTVSLPTECKGNNSQHLPGVGLLKKVTRTLRKMMKFFYP
ncbi:hypothetical protein VNI00_013273 [Paramarasmius palmivorus]|uniref:Uncharacterized protein n=1 Tax=Paramarasmius palmivorus TaxID=297713 RepID=A0AAW0C1M0_9AGAR